MDNVKLDKLFTISDSRVYDLLIQNSDLSDILLSLPGIIYTIFGNAKLKLELYKNSLLIIIKTARYPKDIAELEQILYKQLLSDYETNLVEKLHIVEELDSSYNNEEDHILENEVIKKYFEKNPEGSSLIAYLNQ